VSRDHEEKRHWFLGVDKQILDGVEGKLRWILGAERDEVAGRPHEGTGEGRAGQHRNGYHKPRRLTCRCETVTIGVPRLEKLYELEVVQRYEGLSSDVA